MITIEQDNKKIIASIYGEIDHHTAREMRTAIDARIMRGEPSILVMDFSHVSFMDSSGIGLILGRYKLVSSMGGELQITNMSDRIKRIVELSGVGKLAVISD